MESKESPGGVPGLKAEDTVMYQSTGKPSLSKFRCRLQVMQDASRSGKELAEKWNPKGRYFKIQRDLIRYFDESEKITADFLAYLKPIRR